MDCIRMQIFKGSTFRESYFYCTESLQYKTRLQGPGGGEVGAGDRRAIETREAGGLVNGEM